MNNQIGEEVHLFKVNTAGDCYDFISMAWPVSASVRGDPTRGHQRHRQS
jgi:hypothetical protein